MSDEIMAEVHAIKDKIGAQYAGNAAGLFEDIKRGEAKLRAAGVKILAPPPKSTKSPKSALQRTRYARR